MILDSNPIRTIHSTEEANDDEDAVPMARKGTMTMLSSLVPNAQSLRSLGASGSQDILVNRRMT